MSFTLHEVRFVYLVDIEKQWVLIINNIVNWNHVENFHKNVCDVREDL